MSMLETNCYLMQRSSIGPIFSDCLCVRRHCRLATKVEEGIRHEEELPNFLARFRA